jgi:hypothetical protein
MDSRLRIEYGEILLQIDGKPYKIPKGLDLVKKFKDNSEVMNRTRELAKQYGSSFSSFDCGISCADCNHSYFSVGEEGVVVEGRVEDCAYDGDIDTITVFKGPRKNLFSGRMRFMAREHPCAVVDAFHRALAEQGHLKNQAVEAPAGNFENISRFYVTPHLDELAAQEYQASKA